MANDLESKQAITAAIFRYCRAMDRVDTEILKTLWHPNATFDYGFLSGDDDVSYRHMSHSKCQVPLMIFRSRCDSA